MIKNIETDLKEKNDKLQIKKFDIRSLCKNPAILIIAGRDKGKSWVVKAILEKLTGYPAGIVICPTENADPFYSKIIPKSFIYLNYKSEIIKNIISRQQILKEKEKTSGKIIDKRIFLVMDDCLASKTIWSKDPMIKELLMNGRHYDITFILTMQYSLGIAPDLRSNFDYVFMLYDDIFSNVKRLYDHYAGLFPSVESFREVFLQLTNDYGCMVLNKKTGSKILNNKLFWYKAPDLRGSDFRLGCRQFKNYHTNNYREFKKKIDTNEISNLINEKRKYKKLKIKKI